MLADLKELAAQRGAIRLARAVQKRLWAVRGVKSGSPDRGVKQADYDVLSGVEVPAVLVEVGFIDHPIEGAELLRPEVQAETAKAIADGILEYLKRVR
jgi:N-acetylmuramoyl-L-alanine amidase